MARVLLLTNSSGASAEVLPAIGLLQHQIRIHPAESTSLVEIEDYEIIFLDARRELPNAKSLSKLIRSTGISTPLILITTEGGLSAVSHDWQADDVIWILLAQPKSKREFGSELVANNLSMAKNLAN